MACELLFANHFSFLKGFFIVDGVQKEESFGIFAVHLVFLASTLGHNFLDLTLWEEFLNLVEIEFFEHVLHDIVNAICHIKTL